jgi:hypothetical protein
MKEGREKSWECEEEKRDGGESQLKEYKQYIKPKRLPP